VGYQNLTAITINITAVLNITQCSLVYKYIRILEERNFMYRVFPPLKINASFPRIE
jgi:hypothetical protein